MTSQGYSNCELHYSDKRTGRGSFKGDFRQCTLQIGTWGARWKDWAIYRVRNRHGQQFHNATDETFLLDHDDRYWHNRRFGHAAITGDYDFWEFTQDRVDGTWGDPYVRKVKTVEFAPGDVLAFSKVYHAIARERYYTTFRPNQSLTGGYFSKRDGSCLEACPAGLPYRPDVPRR